MTTIPITHSKNITSACDGFLLDIESWIISCIEAYQDAPPLNGHDQGTYTTSWATYIRATNDRSSVPFLKILRDKIKTHFNDTAAWHHGYWKHHEVHHGTEHCELFLGTLYRIDPTDEITCQQILDVAEHIGNWQKDIPDWLDWKYRVFRSIYLGTEKVEGAPTAAINIPDHFRCVNLALLAFDITSHDQYRHLVETALRPWAQAMTGNSVLPVALEPAGALYTLNKDQDQTYRKFAGEVPDLTEQVSRAENLMASDAITALLRGWKITGAGLFLHAAERLLDILSTQLHDPDAGSASDVIRCYRQITGETRYDKVVLHAVDTLVNIQVNTLSINPTPEKKPKVAGLGKRSDRPDWYEDEKPRCINPILLSLAAEIRDDVTYAILAIDLARAYFQLARRVYPDGRNHGCSARSVSAIARGHGRENHAGMITAVLDPILNQYYN